MIEGICRVCGSALALPVVRCPACDTPHHKDCWEYNRGCSIYGCSPAVRIDAPPEVETAVTLVIPAEQVQATEQRRKTIAATAAAAFSVLWATAGLAVAFEVLIPALTVVWLWEGRREQQEELESMDAGNDPNAGRDLERKAVAALVGAQVPDQLAQAYALFEQRHPRDALAAPQMKLTALELVDHGYWALGLEAAEKALRLPGYNGDPELLQRRRMALLRDPAYLVEGMARPGHSGPTATFSQDEAIAALADMPAGEGNFHLLSLLPQGWSQSLRARVMLPSHAQGPRNVTGAYLAGPFSRDRASAELASRWKAEQPCLAVPSTLLTLPPMTEEVLEVHLSQKEARFRTALGERVVEWRHIRNVIYARIEIVQMKQELQVTQTGNRGGQTMTTVKQREVIDVRPLLEVHFGPAPNRLRIDAPKPDLFNYLGRRRELSHAANLVLTAKDLSRFGPGIRVSHGLTALFSERVAPGMRFPDVDALEEYVLWFWALGTDAVRARWSPTQELLLGRPA